MQVKILSEAGYEESLFGLGLSHGVTSGCTFMRDEYESFVSWYTDVNADDVWEKSQERIDRMEGVAKKLAGKGNGHDKFLRQICVWLDITAPRYWWPEMDQYKVATVTQSESTMHTITKREFDRSMFDTGDCCADHLNTIINVLNALRKGYNNDTNTERKKRTWYMIIQLLPQSFLQRRILTCNYETLRNIINQRTGHRLSEWAVFIDAVKTGVQHPELLP